MTLVKMQPPNKTLKGHKLLLVVQKAPASEALARIQSRFSDLQIQVHELSDESKSENLEKAWQDASIVLTGVTLPTIEQAPKLQFVQITSAGANAILDKPVFKDTEVAFCTANGVHGPQISEWVISTFLAFQHHIPRYLENQREGKWRHVKDPTNDAVSQRVGILGYGSIGRQVARLCTALGMDIHAYTLHARKTPGSKHDDSYAPPGLGDPDGSLPSKWFSGGTKEELHEFLGSGLDLLVVSMPLTEQTKGLIAKDEFQVLSKKKTFVSNIGRGPIVNTDDLMHALNNETIRGAALDVTDPEPLPDGHPLWSAKNVIITPHVSGATTSYNERVMEILIANLTRFSEGKRLMNLVNRKEGY